MKFLRYLAILLGLLLLLYTLICFLGPKNLHVSESKNISASAPIVFNIVNDLRTQVNWNDWNLKDTTMNVTYTENSIGVGATNSWTSELSGDGSQEIIESVENKTVKTKLNFKGWDGDNHAAFDITPNGDKTDLNWSFDGASLPFFMRGFMMAMRPSMVKSYKSGLENIAKIAEERMASKYDGYEIKPVTLDEKIFLVKRQEVKTSAIQQFYATNLGQLFGKIQSTEGIEMDGMPCGLFFRLDERDGKIDMAAAMPISESVLIAEASTFTIDSKNALQVDYYGNYNGSELAHNAIKAYMNDRGLFEDVPIIEEYITDPGEEPDPNKWLTRITYYYSE